MKTHAIEWNMLNNSERTSNGNPADKLNSVTRIVSRAIVALVPAMAITVSAAWLVTMPDLVIYLQAALWTSGLVFFGLALDSEKTTIGFGLATGFALPVLALLSLNIAVEFSIAGVALVAAWIAAGIWSISAKSPTSEQY